MSKHTKTLTAIFAEPTRANIKWRDVIALLEHLGADVSESAGSRVRVALNGMRATIHKPHPRPDIKKSSVDSLRSFLIRAGEGP